MYNDSNRHSLYEGMKYYLQTGLKDTKLQLKEEKRFRPECVEERLYKYVGVHSLLLRRKGLQEALRINKRLEKKGQYPSEPEQAFINDSDLEDFAFYKYNYCNYQSYCILQNHFGEIFYAFLALSSGYCFINTFKYAMMCDITSTAIYLFTALLSLIKVIRISSGKMAYQLLCEEQDAADFFSSMEKGGKSFQKNFHLRIKQGVSTFANWLSYESYQYALRNPQGHKFELEEENSGHGLFPFKKKEKKK